MSRSKRQHLEEQHKRQMASLGQERKETDAELRASLDDFGARVEAQRVEKKKVGRFIPSSATAASRRRAQ